MRFRPAILMVGTVEPRKAYAEAIAAFEHLWAKFPTNAPDLVIVGKAGWKTANLQQRIRTHPEQGRQLFWLDRVSDEALCNLYDSCRGVLIASHGEGFGLPLLEAALHRRHVLARDLAVFREQGLSNVTFFDDDDPESLANALTHLAFVGQQRPQIVMNLPTWGDCVDGLLAELGLAPAMSASVVSRVCPE